MQNMLLILRTCNSACHSYSTQKQSELQFVFDLNSNLNCNGGNCKLSIRKQRSGEDIIVNQCSLLIWHKTLWNNSESSKQLTNNTFKVCSSMDNVSFWCSSNILSKSDVMSPITSLLLNIFDDDFVRVVFILLY